MYGMIPLRTVFLCQKREWGMAFCVFILPRFYPSMKLTMMFQSGQHTTFQWRQLIVSQGSLLKESVKEGA